MEREGNADGDEEREARRTFEHLKPLCTTLLETSSTGGDEQVVVLQSLRRVLKKVPTGGLQRCMDYVLFPLLLLLDAAVRGRSSAHVVQRRPEGSTNTMRIEDKVVEAVLPCVEVVLQRCAFETTFQVTTLLQKLTYAAMLSRSEASEEFRHGVVKCLQALLEHLRPCTSPLCNCKLVSSSPFLALERNPVAIFERLDKSSRRSDTKEELNAACPLGNMQTENMSAAVGHLVSLLLQIAEAEAARGATGSGKLRRDALNTIRAIITKIGTADGVAFFVPGIASGLAKALIVANPRKFASLSPFASISRVSGAAGWPAAVEESVRGLTELLVVALGDENNAEILPSAKDPSGSMDKPQAFTAEAALASLKDRSTQLPSKSEELKEVSVQSERKGTALSFPKAARGEAGLPLRVARTEEWLTTTAVRVNALLLQALPSLCNHHSPSVRLAVAEAAAILLAKCGRSLRICTTLFLECLLALACDDWKHVASTSQTYLNLLLSPTSNVLPKADVGDARVSFSALRTTLVSISVTILSQLPKLALTEDSSMFVLRARQLASAMYFLGPDGVSAHLLNNLVAKQNFTRVLSQCLSFNVSFMGSLEHIVSGKAVLLEPMASDVASHSSDDDAEKSRKQQTEAQSWQRLDGAQAEQLPTVPPWLTRGSAEKVYNAISTIVRLAGLSAVTDQTRGTSLVSLMELLLVDVRLAAMPAGHKTDLSAEVDGANSQDQRSAATAVCILNEIIYGASGAWNEILSREFGGESPLGTNAPPQIAGLVLQADDSRNLEADVHILQENKILRDGLDIIGMHSPRLRWQAADKNEVRKIIRDCAGSILSDYLAPEIWDQPTDLVSANFAEKSPVNEVSLTVFQDNIMLQKVLVDGVGVLGIALGTEFEEGGFLGVALFPMLEKLACPNFTVRNAAVVSLNVLCANCLYSSVRELVVANVDLVIDSLCRQLRHLPTYPNAPILLSAILRHTKSSTELLPLLEEPLRGVVLELDVLARKGHPQLTVPLLRALREMTRATRLEADVLKNQAFDGYLTSMALSDPEICVLRANHPEASTSSSDGPSATEARTSENDIENLVIRLMDRRRCRRAVASIAKSCLTACGPLLASKEPQQCLLALDTLEDGIVTLSHAEAASGQEGKEKECIERLCSKLGLFQVSDNLAKAFDKDASDPNRLLPSMNQLWPNLVLCLRHAHTSVIIRTLNVIVSATLECGGNFFVRRFQKDAVPLFVKLLRGGTTWVQAKPTSARLLLPRTDALFEQSAPAAVLKVQEAALKAIGAIAEHEQSFSALTGSLDVIAAWVVVTACRVKALRDAAIGAVMALAKMDSDLVWFLLVDLIHGGSREESFLSVPPGLPAFSKLLPPCSSPSDGLCMQYSRYEGDLKGLDRNVARVLLAKLDVPDENEIQFSH